MSSQDEVEKMDHIHLYVKDIEKTAKRLTEVLGSNWVGPLDRSPRAIKVAFDDLGIEIVQPTSPDDPIAKYIEEHGESQISVGFKVKDLDAAVRHFETKGVKLLRRAASRPGLRTAVFDGSTTCGMQIELVEYPTVRPYTVVHVDLIPKIPWWKF